MKCAIEGCHMPLGGDTLAEGIAVKQPGELTSRILKELCERRRARPRTRARARRSRCWSASRRRWSRGQGRRGSRRCSPSPSASAGKKVATILCGGNIDTHLLANVLVRDLVRQGRIARLRVAVQDQPGALAAITAKVYEAGANIIEIRHSRIFTAFPPRTR